MMLGMSNAAPRPHPPSPSTSPTGPVPRTGRPRQLRRSSDVLLQVVVCVALGSLAAETAQAKAHLWRISEIFSNADGTIQFIELNECCGSVDERLLTNASLTSNANTYEFPNNLPIFPTTAFGWVLIATADFAALPGAPTPDYIIPPNFFDPAGDTITYVGGADAAVLAPGALPTDGLNALARDIDTGALTVAVNSPINFANEAGSVVPPPQVSTGLPWLVVSAVALAGSVAVYRRRTASIAAD